MAAQHTQTGSVSGVLPGQEQPSSGAREPANVGAFFKVRHNERSWWVVMIGSSWFVRDDRDNDTGPFSDRFQAEAWIKEIRPCEAITKAVQS